MGGRGKDREDKVASYKDVGIQERAGRCRTAASRCRAAQAGRILRQKR